MKIITPEELQERLCFADVQSCVRQTWKNGSEWIANAKAPRRSHGLLLVCSELEAEFRNMSTGESLVARRGDLIYLPRGICYTVRFRNGGSEVDMFTINYMLYGADGEELFFGDRILCTEQGISAECYSAFFYLATVCNSPDESAIGRQAGFLSVLHAVTDQHRRRSESYYAIRKGLKLFMEEWNLNHPIGRYAEASGISETGFYHIFSKWAECSPNEYRTRMRIKTAETMLKHTGYSIRQIAQQIGYDDPYYFSRVFKKREGISPRQYRERYQ